MAQRVDSFRLVNCQNGVMQPMQPGVLYVFRNHGQPVQLLMFCPCGCGDYFSLPLDIRREPHFELACDNGRPTLKPEVERQDGCRSRFQIDNGEVKFR